MLLLESIMIETGCRGWKLLRSKKVVGTVADFVLQDDCEM